MTLFLKSKTAEDTNILSTTKLLKNIKIYDSWLDFLLVCLLRNKPSSKRFIILWNNPNLTSLYFPMAVTDVRPSNI
jgi:hypothetical protein